MLIITGRTSEAPNKADSRRKEGTVNNSVGAEHAGKELRHLQCLPLFLKHRENAAALRGK